MGIITISRGSCRRASEIAERLAKKLGYECVAREILLNASREFNIPEVKLVHAIQDAPSIFDHLKDGKRRYTAFIREAFLEYISEEKARKLIYNIDVERRKWSMYLYGIDTNATELYDLVLQIDNLGLDDAVDFIYEIAKRPCFQTTPESQKKLEEMLAAAKAYSKSIAKAK